MSDKIIPDSIVSKIRKMLAVANDARGNENVAAIAAEKAQSLLTEYNLTLAELGDGSAPQGDDAREKFNGEIPAIYEWQSDLLATLARNNFCVAWTERAFCKPHWGRDKERWRNRSRIIGRRVNIIVTIETYKYLVEAMERLCPHTDKRARSTRSWFAGCTDRLVYRLDTLRHQTEAESRKNDAPRGDGTSLVLADVYSSEDDLNNDLRYGDEAGTTARRRAEWKARVAQRAPSPVTVAQMTPEERARQEKLEARWQRQYERDQKRAEAKIDRSAYNAGSVAGRDIGLDRQIGSDKARIA